MQLPHHPSISRAGAHDFVAFYLPGRRVGHAAPPFPLSNPKIRGYRAGWSATLMRSAEAARKYSLSGDTVGNAPLIHSTYGSM
jgi:hypothetical protein